MRLRLLPPPFALVRKRLSDTYKAELLAIKSGLGAHLYEHWPVVFAEGLLPKSRRRPDDQPVRAARTLSECLAAHDPMRVDFCQRSPLCNVSDHSYPRLLPGKLDKRHAAK